MDAGEFREVGHRVVDLLAEYSPVNFRTRTEHMDQLIMFLEQECHSALQSLSASKSKV